MQESLLIIGVGFMGGSFSLALQKNGYKGNIYGIDIKEEIVKEAKHLGVISEGSIRLEDVTVFKPDTVVLASPVGTFRSIAKKIKPLIGNNTVITDLGSVKGKLVYDLQRILGNLYVGSHPIAGTEKSGVIHSRADLFEGKKIILTPTDKTDTRALEKIAFLWERTGGVLEFMDPTLHDWIFGAVSHVPHAVAFALIDAIDKMSNTTDLFRYSGAGFKDFTRIAASDPIMWRDIFLENKENLLKTLRVYKESLAKLEELIEKEEREKLTEYLQKAKTRRTSLK